MGSQPVSLAKTTRPALGSVARREALFVRLDGHGARTVAWIAGPPGAGKSTLAASYVDARDCRCAWYQLDPDDTDVATFFHYLGHAARKLRDGDAPALPAFTPQHMQDVASFSRRFFRRLFAHAAPQTMLVLDNLHEAAGNTALREVLEAGLAQVPRHCCVIITSRSEPFAALARMRVSGELVCIDGDDLRVGPGEIEEIARLRGVSLVPGAAAKLQERTQGWAAGLVLMLEHAKMSGRISDTPGDATPAVMFDYFAGEIFDRFEAPVQAFLLRVACLPRMTVPVAAELSGDDKAGRLLLNLAHNEYFVREILTDNAPVYQLHPLLREFLRTRAAHILPEAVSAPALHRAAELLLDAGHVEDAVSLLVECGDWEGIARIASAQADTMLAQGRSETLCGWLGLLPAALVDADPRLLHVYAAGSLYSSPRLARRLFEKAYEGLRPAGDTPALVQTCRGIIGAIILEFDDLGALDPWIAVLADLLKNSAASPATAVDPGAAETLIRALLLRDAGNPGLETWLDSAEQAAATQKSAGLPAELSLARAMTAVLRGSAADAESIISRLRSAPAEGSSALRIACSIAAAVGHLFEGSHAAASRAARDGLAIAGAEGLHAYDEWLRILAAAADLGAGERDGARVELKELEAAGARLRRGDRAFVHYLRGWLAALEGDTADANREAKTGLGIAVEVGIPWLECLARLAYAQALLSTDDQRGAEIQVRSATALARSLRSPLLEASALPVAAAASIQSGDEKSALAALTAALGLARKHGFRHLVGVRPQVLAELCAFALRNGIETEFARRLISTAKLAPPRAALHLRQWPRPFQIRMLGGFELLRDSAPVEFSKKGPGRPVELLKVLVALGGRNVRADQLADALWPRVDADYAHKSFTATLHRLRRIFQADDALVLSDTRLSLNPALFWVDTWALEHLIAEIDRALREQGPQPDAAALLALTSEALAVHTGPFLPDESEQPSYIACREQLRAKLQRCLGRVARHLENAGVHDAAADCYLRSIDADPLCEAFHRGLMQCYQRQGETVEALATYDRLRTLLSARLKTMPSAETQALHASLAGQRATPPAPHE
jgi:ATP/maltotriose-dependent transcriptional regulator MalT/DNA-binding SARP family transcriptional activator